MTFKWFRMIMTPLNGDLRQIYLRRTAPQSKSICKGSKHARFIQSPPQMSKLDFLKQNAEILEQMRHDKSKPTDLLDCFVMQKVYSPRAKFRPGSRCYIRSSGSTPRRKLRSFYLNHNSTKVRKRLSNIERFQEVLDQLPAQETSVCDRSITCNGELERVKFLLRPPTRRLQTRNFSSNTRGSVQITHEFKKSKRKDALILLPQATATCSPGAEIVRSTIKATQKEFEAKERRLKATEPDSRLPSSQKQTYNGWMTASPVVFKSNFDIPRTGIAATHSVPYSNQTNFEEKLPERAEPPLKVLVEPKLPKIKPKPKHTYSFINNVSPQTSDPLISVRKTIKTTDLQSPKRTSYSTWPNLPVVPKTGSTPPVLVDLVQPRISATQRYHLIKNPCNGKLEVAPIAKDKHFVPTRNGTQRIASNLASKVPKEPAVEARHRNILPHKPKKLSTHSCDYRKFIMSKNVGNSLKKLERPAQSAKLDTASTHKAQHKIDAIRYNRAIQQQALFSKVTLDMPPAMVNPRVYDLKRRSNITKSATEQELSEIDEGKEMTFEVAKPVTSHKFNYYNEKQENKEKPNELHVATPSLNLDVKAEETRAKPAMSQSKHSNFGLGGLPYGQLPEAVYQSFTEIVRNHDFYSIVPSAKARRHFKIKYPTGCVGRVFSYPRNWNSLAKTHSTDVKNSQKTDKESKSSLKKEDGKKTPNDNEGSGNENNGDEGCPNIGGLGPSDNMPLTCKRPSITCKKHTRASPVDMKRRSQEVYKCYLECKSNMASKIPVLKKATNATRPNLKQRGHKSYRLKEENSQEPDLDLFSNLDENFDTMNHDLKQDDLEREMRSEKRSLSKSDSFMRHEVSRTKSEADMRRPNSAKKEDSDKVTPCIHCGLFHSPMESPYCCPLSNFLKASDYGNTHIHSGSIKRSYSTSSTGHLGCSAEEFLNVCKYCGKVHYNEAEICPMKEALKLFVVEKKEETVPFRLVSAPQLPSKETFKTKFKNLEDKLVNLRTAKTRKVSTEKIYFKKPLAALGARKPEVTYRHIMKNYRKPSLRSRFQTFTKSKKLNEEDLSKFKHNVCDLLKDLLHECRQGLRLSRSEEIVHGSMDFVMQKPVKAKTVNQEKKRPPGDNKSLCNQETACDGEFKEVLTELKPIKSKTNKGSTFCLASREPKILMNATIEDANKSRYNFEITCSSANSAIKRNNSSASGVRAFNTSAGNNSLANAKKTKSKKRKSINEEEDEEEMVEVYCVPTFDDPSRIQENLHKYKSMAGKSKAPLCNPPETPRKRKMTVEIECKNYNVNSHQTDEEIVRDCKMKNCMRQLKEKVKQLSPRDNQVRHANSDNALLHKSNKLSKLGNVANVSNLKDSKSSAEILHVWNKSNLSKTPKLMTAVKNLSYSDEILRDKTREELFNTSLSTGPSYSVPKNIYKIVPSAVLSQKQNICQDQRLSKKEPIECPNRISCNNNILKRHSHKFNAGINPQGKKLAEKGKSKNTLNVIRQKMDTFMCYTSKSNKTLRDPCKSGLLASNTRKLCANPPNMREMLVDALHLPKYEMDQIQKKVRDDRERIKHGNNPDIFYEYYNGGAHMTKAVQVCVDDEETLPVDVGEEVGNCNEKSTPAVVECREACTATAPAPCAKPEKSNENVCKVTKPKAKHDELDQECEPEEMEFVRLASKEGREMAEISAQDEKKINEECLKIIEAIQQSNQSPKSTPAPCQVKSETVKESPKVCDKQVMPQICVTKSPRIAKRPKITENDIKYPVISKNELNQICQKVLTEIRSRKDSKHGKSHSPLGTACKPPKSKVNRPKPTINSEDYSPKGKLSRTGMQLTKCLQDVRKYLDDYRCCLVQMKLMPDSNNTSSTPNLILDDKNMLAADRTNSCPKMDRINSTKKICSQFSTSTKCGQAVKALRKASPQSVDTQSVRSCEDDCTKDHIDLENFMPTVKDCERLGQVTEVTSVLNLPSYLEEGYEVKRRSSTRLDEKRRSSSRNERRYYSDVSASGNCCAGRHLSLEEPVMWEANLKTCATQLANIRDSIQNINERRLSWENKEKSRTTCVDYSTVYYPQERCLDFPDTVSLESQEQTRNSWRRSPHRSRKTFLPLDPSGDDYGDTLSYCCPDSAQGHESHQVAFGEMAQYPYTMYIPSAQRNRPECPSSPPWSGSRSRSKTRCSESGQCEENVSWINKYFQGNKDPEERRCKSRRHTPKSRSSHFKDWFKSSRSRHSGSKEGSRHSRQSQTGSKRTQRPRKFFVLADEGKYDYCQPKRECLALTRQESLTNILAKACNDVKSTVEDCCKDIIGTFCTNDSREKDVRGNRYKTTLQNFENDDLKRVKKSR